MTSTPPPRSERLRHIFYRTVYILSRPNTYTVIALMLMGVLVIGTVLIMLIEQQSGGEPALRNWDAAFTYMLQNVTGVGLAAKVPLTMAGRGTAVSIVLIGAATRALLIAAIVSGFVNRLLVQGRGVKRVNLQNHIIICGFNPRVKQVVEVLGREAFGAGVPVVLLAPLPQNPLPDEKLKFVSGNPAHAADLDRAGIKTARAAIAVTDESDHDPHTDSTYDARTVLTVLSLKNANPALHVVAQMRDPENRDHYIRARADEIIASAEMSEGLLGRAALNLGIATAFSMLLRLDTPQEMYIIDTPPALLDKSFQAALVHHQLRTGNILLGVIDGDKTLLCPPSDYKLNADSRLIVLGNVRPPLTH